MEGGCLDTILLVQSLMDDSIKNVGDSLKVVLECSRAQDTLTATLIAICVFGPSLFQREGKALSFDASLLDFSVADV